MPEQSLEMQALFAIVAEVGHDVYCQWFRNCDRLAVTTVFHPVLDYVPCCQRCADKARGI